MQEGMYTTVVHLFAGMLKGRLEQPLEIHPLEEEQEWIDIETIRESICSELEQARLHAEAALLPC